jgi:ABC-type transporter Mla MlaB component
MTNKLDFHNIHIYSELIGPILIIHLDGMMNFETGLNITKEFINFIKEQLNVNLKILCYNCSNSSGFDPVTLAALIKIKNAFAKQLKIEVFVTYKNKESDIYKIFRLYNMDKIFHFMEYSDFSRKFLSKFKKDNRGT